MTAGDIKIIFGLAIALTKQLELTSIDGRVPDHNLPFIQISCGTFERSIHKEGQCFVDKRCEFRLKRENKDATVWRGHNFVNVSTLKGLS